MGGSIAGIQLIEGFVGFSSHGLYIWKWLGFECIDGGSALL